MESGFTLLESLIAVLVIAIGFLSVSALSIKSLQAAHVGYQRTLASLMAADAQEHSWKLLEVNGGQCQSIQGSAIALELSQRWVRGEILYDGRETLPNVTFEIDDLGDCEFGLTVSWDESRFSLQDSRDTFEYVFRVPRLLL